LSPLSVSCRPRPAQIGVSVRETHEEFSGKGSQLDGPAVLGEVCRVVFIAPFFLYAVPPVIPVCCSLLRRKLEMDGDAKTAPTFAPLSLSQNCHGFRVADNFKSTSRSKFPPPRW